MKHNAFNEIVRTVSFTVPPTDIYPEDDRTFKNTNELILSDSPEYYSYCTGIKTGFTPPAGECLVASSKYNNIELISVVLGGEETDDSGFSERFHDTKNLLEFTYNNYSIREIAQSGDKVATINVGKATKGTSSLDIIVDSKLVILEKGRNNKKYFDLYELEKY